MAENNRSVELHRDLKMRLKKLDDDVRTYVDYCNAQYVGRSPFQLDALRTATRSLSFYLGIEIEV